MTELTKILRKSYDNADFQNFLGKSYEKLKKNLCSSDSIHRARMASIVDLPAVKPDC